MLEVIDKKRKTRASIAKNGRSWIMNIGFGAIVVIILFNTSTWVKELFPDATFNQILFFLMVPELQTLDNNYILNNFLIMLLESLLLLLLICVFLLIINTEKILNYNFYRIVNTFQKIVIIILLALMDSQFEIIKFFKAQLNRSEFIYDNYVNPNSVQIDFPESKRNLIHIYLESMESSFVGKNDGGLVENNLIPKLTSLSNSNINFSENSKIGGFKPIFGTGWTIAALFSSSSGLPFITPIDANSYDVENFFPGVISLGDILSKQGYNQVFMIGSDAKFGGRLSYYKQHGNYEIWDYHRAILENKMDTSDYVWWGYEDENLYKYAKEKLNQLHQEDKPFNFTMLTVDTHTPNGWMSTSCIEKYNDKFKNVLSCADDMLDEFINWVQKQDFYENTTIIVTGDHLYMGELSFISKEYKNQRSVLSIFINTPIKPINEKERLYSSLDLFPTSLASLDVHIEGEKLGLGVNLFSNHETLLEKYGVEHINKEFSSYSEFYFKTFY